MELNIYNHTYNILCNLIKTKNPNLLDIGCGPGNITKYLKLKRPAFNISGLDVQVKMIELAKKNNPSDNFEVMDIRLLENEQRKFDTIVCGFILPYLSSKDRKILIKN